MSSSSKALLTAILLAVPFVGTPGASQPAAADEAEEGRSAYVRICSKCHGLVTEDPVSQRPQNLRLYAVMAPLGPNLSGIVGRPAGIVEGYPYSRAFREAAPGIVWDEGTLYSWITNSQAMIRGSMMFVKVKEPDSSRIIDYLKKYGRYHG